jgi:dTDP-4-dehydrorhamnose reductase
MLIEITTRQITGIIHISGASRISRYGMAEIIADKLNLDKKFLNPISISQMNWIAMRPRDSSLDVSYANSILKNKPQKIEYSLNLFVDQIKNKT